MFTFSVIRITQRVILFINSLNGSIWSYLILSTWILVRWKRWLLKKRLVLNIILILSIHLKLSIASNGEIGWPFKRSLLFFCLCMLLFVVISSPFFLLVSTCAMPLSSIFIFLTASSTSLLLLCKSYIISFIYRTIVVILKFIFNTSLIVQYVSDGTWNVDLFVRHDGLTTNYPPDSFQFLYIIGFYKNDGVHESPFMSSLIWDLLFILLLNYCKSKLRV